MLRLRDASQPAEGKASLESADVLDVITGLKFDFRCYLQAGKKKDLKVSKDATLSKPVVPEAPLSPVPPKAKNAVPDEFAVVCARAAEL